MRCYITIGFCSLFFVANLFSQNKTTKQTVVKGATIAQIAQKITHKVVTKETLFGIQKRYGITAEALFNANPFLEKEGLQIGQTLLIPTETVNKTTTIAVSKGVSSIFHLVQPQETKFSIAQKYQTTIEALEKLNPEIINNLPAGYNLLIKGSRPKEEKKVAPLVSKTPADKLQSYTVQPKETFYSLSKMTGLSQEELIHLNPSLENGVQEGMVLQLPSSTKTIPTTEPKKTVLLSKQNGSDRKKLVLLLPFNATKIVNDTINSTLERLKKDKFLNMTLDFYSGALIAIDSAKQLGLSVDVRVFDSEETKTSSEVSSIITNNDLKSAQVIIGPFYQSNVEKTAELLADSNVAVISPLSKETGKAFPNLYQSIVATDVIKNTAFDFMKRNNGNIIVVIDKKKESSRQYYSEFQPQVKIAPLTPTGGLSAEGLKTLLDKNTINYVILETGNTSLIRAVMAILSSMQKTHTIQLVTLENNPTLDTDEISFTNLVKLKLLYPATIRENRTVEAQIFEQKYRKENKVAPNSFATRGFDLTFDTLMRMSQDKSFEETIKNDVTEQVENKFEYYPNASGGYINKGVYLLYYDADMTIKQAK